jgi:hypothetical protein
MEQRVSSPTPDPEAVERLKAALRELHLRNGKPSLRRLAAELEIRQTNWSHATVERVLKCKPKLPSLDQLRDLVAVLNGNRAKFDQLWLEAHGLEPEDDSAVREQPVQPGQCTGVLTTPPSGGTVGNEIRVEGLVRAVPARHHVWITHQDRRGLFWAKDFELILDSDGRFERIVYEGGTLRQFTLQLTLVSRAGHNQLVDWIAECGRTGSYPGIPPAPDRFHVLDSVALNFDPATGIDRLITVQHR